jgi:hypothetical protein
MKTDAKFFLAGVCALGLAIFGSLNARAVSFGSMPLWFEGSAESGFTARGLASQFTVSSAGTEFTLMKPTGENATCRMQFLGASPASQMSGLQPLSGKISRFDGGQPQNWHLGLATCAQVQMSEVYPGINVIFYGNQNVLEYDFNLAAGADASQIAIIFSGAEKLSLTKDGSLVIHLHAGDIVQHAPIAYQIVNGLRREVHANYRLLNSHTATFALGSYDRNLPLVIDPLLTYSTYFGGNYGDAATAIAVNPTDGSIYIAGQTYSTKVSNNIPFASSDAFDTNYNKGKFTGDAFVARFDSTGTNLIYATYLGGSDDDGALALAVDAAGNAFVAGFTSSTNFPTTNAFSSNINSARAGSLRVYPVDAFVAELNPSGDSLVYSTYLGGNSMDTAYGLAIDAADNAYVTGFTYSTNFPVTPNAFQPTLQCSNSVYYNANAFVSVIPAGGGSLAYSTYLGGTNFDEARAIAYNNGRVFVTGFTSSTNFPATNFLADFKFLNGNENQYTNSKKSAINLSSDAFVTAFNASSPSSLTMVYSTLLGGTNNDVAHAIAADAAGNAFVAGYTMSTNFPYTTTNVPDLTDSFVHTNDFKKHFTWATNGFLTQIKWDGASPSIGYSTMFGGRGVNVANGVALDADGNAYVVGSAGCTNFPVTTNLIYPPLTSTNNSKKKGDSKTRLSDAVIIVFNADASQLLFSAYLGGKENDYGNAIAVDAAGNAYLAGQTLSTNFPTVNPWQSNRTGTNDMFIAKISADELLPLSILPTPAPNIAAKVGGWTGLPPTAGVTLRWRTAASNQLESATDITRPNWHAVSRSPVFTNGWYQLQVPATNVVEFFRLRRP